MIFIVEQKLSMAFRRLLFNIGVFSLLTLLSFSAAFPQNSRSDPSSGSGPAATPSPIPASTPIQIGSMVSELEKTATKTREVREFVSRQRLPQSVIDGVHLISSEVRDLTFNTNSQLAGRNTLESVSAIEREWMALDRKTGSWASTIQDQIVEVDKSITSLDVLKDLWNRSIAAVTQRSQADTANNAIDDNTADVIPPEILRRVNDAIAEIDSAKKLAGERRAELLTIESGLSESQSEINTHMEDLKNKREGLLSNIFKRDDVALWSPAAFGSERTSFSTELKNTLNAQTEAFWIYLARYPQRFAFHGFFFIGVLALMFWIRKKITPIAAKEPKLVNQAAFFKMPVASALVISTLLASVIYPQSPRLLLTILGTALIIPGVLLLRQTIEKPLNYLLYGLLIFYIADRVRDIVQDLIFVNRVIFAFEMLAAFVLLIWFHRSNHIASQVEAGTFKVYSIIKKAIPITAAAFGIAFIANITGFVSLSYLIGSGLLRSAYSALIIYTVVRILSAAVAFALRVKPFNLLGSVRQNRSLIRQNITRYISWGMLFLWVIVVLNIFSIHDTVYAVIADLFSYEVGIGEISFAIGDIVLFLVTIWAATQISRLIRFFLEEDVFPRVGLGGGISFSISSVIHYLVIIVGFLIAIAAVGIEMSRFAVILGAIGVGIGFGLQSIVNNFISGLILLFERPVKVGDTVELSGQIGKLRKIGLRASVLKKADGAEVIVPNSQLITDEVVNWTGSDDNRRIDIQVGVAYGTDPHRVMELLNEIPLRYDLVLSDPPPLAIFKGLGSNALEFESRFWVHDGSGWVSLRSKVVTAILDAFVKEGIEMPSTQYDLNLKATDAEKLTDKSATDNSGDREKN